MSSLTSINTIYTRAATFIMRCSSLLLAVAFQVVACRPLHDDAEQESPIENPVGSNYTHFDSNQITRRDIVPGFCGGNPKYCYHIYGGGVGGSPCPGADQVSSHTDSLRTRVAKSHGSVRLVVNSAWRESHGSAPQQK